MLRKTGKPQSSRFKSYWTASLQMQFLRSWLQRKEKPQQTHFQGTHTAKLNMAALLYNITITTNIVPRLLEVVDCLI